MHKLTGLMGAVLTLAVLSGCSADHHAESDVMTKPVLQEVKKGMTRQQVRNIAGPPASTITMVYAHGACQTYVLGEHDGKAQTYFISYSDSDQVVNYGFQSCKEYDTYPQAD